MAGSDILNPSHVSPKVFYSGQLANTIEDVLYTVPASGSAILKHGTVCNTTGSGASFSLSLVPAGQALGTAVHAVVWQYFIAAFDTLPLGDLIEGACLGPSDQITAQAGTAAALSIVLTGVENT